MHLKIPETQYYLQGAAYFEALHQKRTFSATIRLGRQQPEGVPCALRLLQDTHACACHTRIRCRIFRNAACICLTRAELDGRHALQLSRCGQARAVGEGGGGEAVGGAGPSRMQ